MELSRGSSCWQSLFCFSLNILLKHKHHGHQMCMCLSYRSKCRCHFRLTSRTVFVTEAPAISFPKLNLHRYYWYIWSQITKGIISRPVTNFSNSFALCPFKCKSSIINHTSVCVLVCLHSTHYSVRKRQDVGGNVWLMRSCFVGWKIVSGLTVQS